MILHKLQWSLIFLPIAYHFLAGYGCKDYSPAYRVNVRGRAGETQGRLRVYLD